MYRLPSTLLIWTLIVLLGVSSATFAAGKRSPAPSDNEPLFRPHDVLPAQASPPGTPAPVASPSISGGTGGWLPGGPQGQVGSPYYYTPQTYDPVANMPGGDPYTLHFGPGYYRSAEYGHHRFPYYSYRRPWYFPGHTSYNRDTNYPW